VSLEGLTFDGHCDGSNIMKMDVSKLVLVEKGD
jgi:hypothetical protein